MVDTMRPKYDVVAARSVLIVEPVAARQVVATHGVVNDEPARGGVVDDERRDEPRDEPRDVPRHPDAWRR
jgi:hypothetical protein